jgi:hypothetical protein
MRNRFARAEGQRRKHGLRQGVGLRQHGGIRLLQNLGAGALGCFRSVVGIHDAALGGFRIFLRTALRKSTRLAGWNVGLMCVAQREITPDEPSWYALRRA